MEQLNKESKILIATFSPWMEGKRLPMNGNIDPLIDFFSPKVKRLALIDQQYPGSDDVIPRVEVYEEGQLIKKSTASLLLYILYPFLKVFNYNATHVIFKLRDFFSVILYGLQSRSSFDYFIGLESINAIAGIFLRKIGKVEKVVYYVFEYSPNRYNQKWFNRLYLWLDQFCVKNADFVWDVSSEYKKVRIQIGLDPQSTSYIIHVPIGLYADQISTSLESEIIPQSLVFMGSLGPENGPDIAVEAFKILEEKFPQSKLHIIGAGKGIDELKKLVNTLNLNEKVVFHGYIIKRKELTETLSKFQIALAPYKYSPGAPRLYGYAIKIQLYLAAGVPVVTSMVPPLGKKAAEEGAALQVDDNPRDFAGAITKILSNRKIYNDLRKNANQFNRDLIWENVFNTAFKKMSIISKKSL